MVIIFEHLSADQADTYRLVLSSSGISHRSKKEKHGWNILVNNTEHEKAINTIEQYLKENQNFHQTDEPLCHEYQKTFTELWVSVILLASHVAITIGNDSEILIRTYGSSAFHILRGELYRSVTSLMIHANAKHLAGNMVGIAIFGNAVCSITGRGVGWFMILATGVLGNLMNAVLYKTGHLSIGASTAVFGAVGILAAHQFFKKLRLPIRRMKAWLPLGAGLALLSIFGSGKHADVTAHLFGFMAGLILGAFYAVLVKRLAAMAYQIYFLLAALIVLVMSWMRGLGNG
ncbi:MAG: rhomboid family intramembrane serine protease [Desulfobacteraceae bacterium]|nr:rhomboid family intramembrane serine protease [Desulfobacteraceae bacterium]MBC2719106.1 rhomboid family intramembrane serine protease [Desulfobacteraceae bacterium]